MTAVALVCWRCQNKTTEVQYCSMMEELQEEREYCRQTLFQDTLQDCGDEVCEECCRPDRCFEFGREDEECSDFKAFTIDTFK